MLIYRDNFAIITYVAHSHRFQLQFLDAGPVIGVWLSKPLNCVDPHNLQSDESSQIIQLFSLAIAKIVLCQNSVPFSVLTSLLYNMQTQGFYHFPQRHHFRS